MQAIKLNYAVGDRVFVLGSSSVTPQTVIAINLEFRYVWVSDSDDWVSTAHLDSVFKV